MNELYYFQDGKSEETLRGKWGKKENSGDLFLICVNLPLALAML